MEGDSRKAPKRRGGERGKKGGEKVGKRGDERGETDSGRGGFSAECLKKLDIRLGILKIYIIEIYYLISVILIKGKF